MIYVVSALDSSGPLREYGYVSEPLGMERRVQPDGEPWPREDRSSNPF